jgi:hypothetical protein
MLLAVEKRWYKSEEKHYEHSVLIRTDAVTAPIGRSFIFSQGRDVFICITIVSQNDGHPEFGFPGSNT